MALEQLKVKEIVRRAVNKEVDLPEFQRDFVWDPEQVKLLVMVTKGWNLPYLTPSEKKTPDG
ncbi:MAG: hypothetical protein PWQ60_1261 [Thermoanaerobacteraceae bacterium]|jgi:hypothetical protein|nr:hypothetical protein [Thermoanaerobacteraceae bacterium]